VLREETGRGTAEARRGTGPSTSTPSEETTSGRASSQQGHAATCTASRTKPWSIGRERAGGLAHALVGAPRAGEHRPRSWGHDPRRGTPSRRRRGSRSSDGHTGDTIRDAVLDYHGQRSRWRAAEQTRHVRGVGERARKLPRAWEGYAAIRPRHHWLPTGLGKSDRPG
jgi:hypothetical protein